MQMNEIIPFSHEEAGEAMSEEKVRGSKIASTSSAKIMIKDGVIVEEEETMSNATNSSDADTSFAAERNPKERRPPSYIYITFCFYKKEDVLDVFCLSVYIVLQT